MYFRNSRSVGQSPEVQRNRLHPAALICSVLILLVAPASSQVPVKLSLHDAIDQAQTGLLAREGQDRVDAAHGLVTGAALRPNPRVYLSSEDIQPWNSNFNFTNKTEDYGYLGQLIELGGKRSSRLGFARATFHQTEAERTLLLQQIAARVAAAYWSAVASQSVLPLLEQDMKAVDQIVVYNQGRVAAGATRGVDLLRAQIERDRLQLALETARRDVILSRIELFRQMGRSPEAQVELTDGLESSVPIASQSVATVLAARADVLVARDAVAAAEANLKLQRSLAVPDPDILGGYKRNSGADTLFFSLQIPVSIFNRNQGEVERARATIRLEQDRLSQLELAIRTEVKAANEAYLHQQQIVGTILPDMRARARQNLKITDEAYRLGGLDLLRYLDAERTEFDIEVSALRAQAEFQLATVRLQIAYGVQP